MEVKIPGLFDYINSITNHEYIYDGSCDKAYNQYMINYNFSLYPDTIHIANQVNEMKLSNKQHYDFYFNLVRKGKRFTKWPKHENSDRLNLISGIYNVTIEKAKEISELLDDEYVEYLKIQKGGKNVE